MNDLAAVIKRFPENEFLLRRLYASEDEFRALCEEYALAIGAISHVPKYDNRQTMAVYDGSVQLEA